MTAGETWRRVFASRVEAEAYLAERGFSVGRMQGPYPRGILLGKVDIQKWRNLSRADRAELDGFMQRGPEVDSPVTVTIFADAPAEAHAAIRQANTVPARTKPAWLVTESSYGKVTGRRQLPHREEADKTADVWRRQSAGVVTVERCEVPV